MTTKTINYKGCNYEVSDTGRVWLNGRELIPVINKDGYRQHPVKDESSCLTTLRYARAVALAFIENDDPINKTEVNHKDYNRQNDNVDNLEWVSHGDNVRYSIQNRKDISGTNNPNYRNRVLSKKYAENPEIAKEKQLRPGSKNGRARKIILLHDGDIVGQFSYIGACCEYLRSELEFKYELSYIRAGINKSIRSGAPFKGFLFKVS